MSATVEQARQAFRAVFGRPPAGVAVAPGRVNLIGEHTDYNDGFVLPMAIDRHVAVAFGQRSDGVLWLHAAAFADTRELPLAALAPGGVHGWAAYPAGMAWALDETGFRIAGADLAIAGDLPIGAGLASSAALEMAAARAFCALAARDWDPLRMARLGQTAEQVFAGVACGIMDQLASAAAQQGAALLIDCRSGEFQPVPLSDDVVVMVMNTGITRELAASAYNDRRRACERAVDAIRPLAPDVTALRDVDAGLLEGARSGMDPVTFRRASHVVAEMARPAAMAAALAARDYAAAGRLMDDSHASLRDLYEVSCAELDAMAEEARRQPGCYGARMTGAGFGGCAIALVAAGRTEAFLEQVAAGYRVRTGRAGTLFACRPAAGARLV